MWKRYVVEIGTGLDLHGLDVTKAAKKAVKDAVSHSCLCGIMEIHGVTKPDTEMRINMKIASPLPEKLDIEEVKKQVPFGQVEVEVEEGGLMVDGVHVDVLGEGDQIVLVNVALTVYINV